MNKKKHYFYVVAFIIVTLVTFGTVPCYADDDQTFIIISNGGSLGGDTGHHAPALIPIQAVYSSSLSTIFVNFLYDLGSVSVEIENLTTGAYSQTTINATQGVHPFLITGDEGVYEITFTLPNGQVYSGSFEIE